MKTMKSTLPLTHALWLKLALCLALSGASLTVLAASPPPAAGDIIYSNGQATLTHQGQTVAATKGSAVQSGDTLSTGQGQAQIKFSDGGYVALGAQSEFSVEQYINANNAQHDTFLTRLVRGSMRAITGLIGKRNHKNYLVETKTATLGIRGSSYLLAYQPDGSILASCEQDGIEICTRAGCVALAAGERAWVYAADEAPVVVSSQADIPPIPARRDPTLANEGVDSQGQAWPALGITVASTTPAPTPVPLPGSITTPAQLTLVNTVLAPPPTPYVPPYTTGLDGTQVKMTTDSAGHATVFQDGGCCSTWTLANPSDAEGKTIAGSLSATGQPTPDFLYLGRWRGNLTSANDGGSSTANAMPYVVGVETSGNALPSLTAVGQSLSYSFSNPAYQYVSALRPDGTIDHNAGAYQSGWALIRPDTGAFSVQLALNLNPYTNPLNSTTDPGGLYTITANDFLYGGRAAFSTNAHVLVCRDTTQVGCSADSGQISGFLSGNSGALLGVSAGFNDAGQGAIGSSLVLSRGADTAPSASVGGLSLAMAPSADGSGNARLYSGNITATTDTATNSNFVAFATPAKTVAALSNPLPASTDVAGMTVAGSLNGNTASSDYVYLGRWNAPGVIPVTGLVAGPTPINAMPYVLGSETPVATLSGLGANNATLTYALDPNSQYVTAVRSGGAVDTGAGYISSASLSVTPATGNTTMNMALAMNAYNTVPADTVNISATGSLNAGSSDFNSTGTITCSSCASNGKTAQTVGMILGSNAQRAGVAVQFVDGGFGSVGAAAVLNRGATH